MKIDKRKVYFHMIGAGYRNVAELSDRTGVHRNTIAGYLTGRRSIFPSVIEKLCQALKVHPLDLLESDTGAASETTLSSLSRGNTASEQ